MFLPSVAVIDIGSNSIKLLVAALEPDGNLSGLASRTLETRISAGIGRDQPRLSEGGMISGLASIQSLLADAKAFSPKVTVLVATSAVRDAENGADFRSRVKSITGHSIRILSGNEEANLIGRGLICDPALAHLENFYVFDLGGGSLEALLSCERKIQQAVSLQLGCVRLTEKFVPDSSLPHFQTKFVRRFVTYTKKILAESSFEFLYQPLPQRWPQVARSRPFGAVLGAQKGQTFASTDSRITVRQLRELLSLLSPLSLAERQKIPGLPPARADIFPAALTTMIAVAEAGKLESFQNSLYNLRWGIAAEALSEI